MGRPRVGEGIMARCCMTRGFLSWAGLMGEFPLTFSFSIMDWQGRVFACVVSGADTDRHTVFDDTFVLELAVSAYYSQISHFSIDV